MTTHNYTRFMDALSFIQTTADYIATIGEYEESAEIIAFGRTVSKLTFDFANRNIDEVFTRTAEADYAY